MHADRSPRAQDAVPRSEGAGLERVDALLGHLRPLEGSSALEARVLRRIHAGGGARASTARRTTGVWIGAGVAALAATAVGAWLVNEGGAPGEARPPLALTAQRLDESAAPSEVDHVKPDGRASSDTAPTSASPAASSVAAPARAAPAPAKPEVASTKSIESPPPESLLYRAAMALRRDRDPAGALDLLHELRAEAPGLGAREEARALEVEAHHRLGSPRTRALAEAYLHDFPNGRFRATALNVLGGSRGGE